MPEANERVGGSNASDSNLLNLLGFEVEQNPWYTPPMALVIDRTCPFCKGAENCVSIDYYYHYPPRPGDPPIIKYNRYYIAQQFVLFLPHPLADLREITAACGHHGASGVIFDKLESFRPMPYIEDFYYRWMTPAATLSKSSPVAPLQDRQGSERTGRTKVEEIGASRKDGLSWTAKKNVLAVKDCNMVALGLLSYQKMSRKGQVQWDYHLSQNKKWEVAPDVVRAFERELRQAGTWERYKPKEETL